MRLLTWFAVASLGFGVTGGEVFAHAMQQVQGTTLRGLVLDRSGAVVPGAQVTVFQGAEIVVQATTDRAGVFTFPGLPGQYRVDVLAQGFTPLHSSEIPFAGNETTRFSLEVGVGVGGVIQPPTPPLPLGSSHTGTGRLMESPVRAQANVRSWEFGALFQGGVGLTEDRGSFRFLLAGAHLGKVLTPEFGTGLLRGNFEYAGELFPYWQALTPTFPRISCPASTGPQGVNPNSCSAPYSVGGTAHGVSVTPIILRWNLTHGTKVMPWVQGAGGVVWTNHKFPAYGDTNPQDGNETGPGSDTSVWNFTPQFGVGAHVFVKPRHSLDFSANAVHISSASLGDRNPGVNASVQFSVGYSWWSR